MNKQEKHAKNHLLPAFEEVVIRDEQHKIIDGNIRHAIYNRSLQILVE